MDKITYPVAARHKIPAKSGLFDTLKRRLSTIPTDRQDYDAVLDINNHYELVPNGTPVAEAQGIRDAVAIYFVDIRPADLMVELEVPCRDHVERRAVQVRYRARVMSSELILQDRVHALAPMLESWTQSVVTRDSAAYYAEEHQQFIDTANISIRHRLIDQPPVSPAGMEISLLRVDSDLPDTLDTHRGDLLHTTRDADRRVHSIQQNDRVDTARRTTSHDAQLDQNQSDYIVWSSRQKFDDEVREKGLRQDQEYAAMLEDAYRRGPQAVLALIAARDPAAMEQLVSHGIQDREFLANLLMKAAESGEISSTVIENILESAGQQLVRGPGSQIENPAKQGQIDRGSPRGESSTTSESGFDPDDDSLDHQTIRFDEDEEDDLSTILGMDKASTASETEGSDDPIQVDESSTGGKVANAAQPVDDNQPTDDNGQQDSQNSQENYKPVSDNGSPRQHATGSSPEDGRNPTEANNDHPS